MTDPHRNRFLAAALTLFVGVDDGVFIAATAVEQEAGKQDERGGQAHVVVDHGVSSE